jgi:hypothetical protein
MADGRVFVPCRHEHGHGEEAANFDHKIFSINTSRFVLSLFSVFF